MNASHLINLFDRKLKPKGFRRKKATWNRGRDAFVEVIDVQTSKDGDSVTLNAGVLSLSIYSLCWGRDAEPFIEEPFCTVRARIGQLLDNKDLWWEVGDTRAIDDMTDRLERQIFPFLERMRSLGGMRDWLASTGVPSPKSPLPSLCFAVLQSQLGDMDNACAVLSDLEHRALGAWEAKAQEIAARIGCRSRTTSV